MQLFTEGKCMFMRLKVNENRPEMDVERYLLSLLFGEPILPPLFTQLPEGWLVFNFKLIIKHLFID